MSLLAPAALFLSLLLPVIVLLYLLKLRRTERTVPSTYLWRQMVRDVEANAPWQRLKFNILLLLQLLFLALLIFALARPTTKAQGISARAAILIVDTSASMAATDVTPARLGAAKDLAHRLVDNMPGGANLTLIAAGQKAQVAVSQTTDLRQVNQAIDALQIQPGGSDLATALQLASAIAARQPDAEIVVLSDGKVSLPNRISIQGKINYLPIGLKDDNQAISLLNLQNDPSGGLTAFAQVANYGSQPVKRRIAFYADGSLVDTFDLELQPGAEQAVIASNLISTTQTVDARLLTDDATVDYLPLDDHAAVVYQPAQPISVTLVSPGNLFLEAALSLLPNVQTTRLNPGSQTALPNSGLTILDGQVPITGTLPSGSLLYVGPLSSTGVFTVTGQLLNPKPLPVSQDDPLLRFVNLDTVSILDAARIPLPDWAQPVILASDPTVPSRQQPPLLFIGETGGRRVAVLAFDLRHSDLPLQVAFPVLFANLIDWLAPGRSGALPQTVAPGDVLTLPLPVTALSTATLDRPDGTRLSVTASDGRMAIAETSQLGVYGLDLGDGRKLAYTVNLFSPQESSIAPAQTLPVTGASTQQAGGAGEQADREWWRLFAMLALALLFVEWMVYHRPALVRIYQQVRR